MQKNFIFSVKLKYTAFSRKFNLEFIEKIRYYRSYRNGTCCVNKMWITFKHQYFMGIFNKKQYKIINIHMLISLKNAI